MRYLPPVGLPLATGEVWGSLSGVAAPGAERRRLVRELGKRMPETHIHLRVSGRDALCQLLLACRSCRPDRSVVIMAGYTCWSVPAAAIRAGLTIGLVDIDPRTLDFDEESLASIDGDGVLALITHHLLGYPNRMDRVEEAAERWGAFLIDDAAQGFGASVGGKAIGTLGHAGVLSFGRGKGIPALGGGAALVHRMGKELESHFDHQAPNGPRGAGCFATAVAHQIFFPPERYHIPARLPFLGLGKTEFDTRFGKGSMQGYAAALARRLLAGFDERRRMRAEIARRYESLLGAAKRIGTVKPVEGGEPSYLRFAVRLPAEPGAHERAAATRLGISTLYPAPVNEIPGLPDGAVHHQCDLTGCREVARTLATLPTHPSVTIDDQEKIARFLEGLR